MRWMSQYQVLQSLGHPDRRRLGPEIFQDQREKGVVERWDYESHPQYSSVLFDIDGVVMGWQKLGEDRYTFFPSRK